LIILDTNVLSAVMRRATDPRVVEWLGSQPRESIWTTTVTTFEVRFGLELLPDSRRRKILEAAFDKAIREDLDRRVLAFDEIAAGAAAMIAARQRRGGRPTEIRDVQIAGITAAHKASLATRNSRHFEHTGISIIDPWSLPGDF
jgi:toxin FitB